MKHRLLTGTLIIVLSLAAALPALAGDPAPGSTCGTFFGQHVADHGLEGHLGQEHNPGMHEGLAGFDGHEEHVCP